jgi:hypothetical protein
MIIHSKMTVQNISHFTILVSHYRTKNIVNLK